MTKQGKFTVVAVGILAIAGLTLGNASAAFASILHQGYTTMAQCVQAEGIWDSHGYRITVPCTYTWTNRVGSYTFWTLDSSGH
jgi:hypothetical protein